jgi:hypothetical protein
MAWSDTGDFTSGQILTAAAMDKVREAMFFGQATFTNEAARDTAFANPGALAPITLQEGMRAYLTAPTVPAATGATTALPTGITTIYNGTNWVCATPVSAFTATNGTTTSTSFTATLTSGGTNPSVTLVTGTTALVMVSATTSCTSGFTHNMGVAVSGATTLAASTAQGVYSTQSTANRHSDQYVLTGLTAGTNTFTLQYITAAGTASFSQRNITVIGIA